MAQSKPVTGSPGRSGIALLVGMLLSLITVLIWSGGLFMDARLRLNDLYYVPEDTSGSIVIIAMDDASLRRYGRTPTQWPRTTYVTLLDQLARSNARVVAFDLLFSEREADDQAVGQALAALRDNSARTRVVLATAGINGVAAKAADAEYALPFANDLPIAPIIAEQANYLGYTNTIPNVDGVIRQALSFLLVDREQRVSFSLAVYLAYLRIPASSVSQVLQAVDGELILPNQTRVPIDDFGLWRPYFFAPPASPEMSAFTVVSFGDVVNGLVDPGLFNDKIVLVGLMFATGALDEYQVPSSTRGNLMAGVEIQANAIESLLQGKAIRELPIALQATMLGALAFGATLGFSALRWYFKTALVFALLVVGGIGASILFSVTRMQVPVLDVILAIALPFAVAVGLEISREIQQRMQKEFLLESLQRIANQRLDLKQAAVFILEDLQRAAPGADIALIVFDKNHAEGYQRFATGTLLTEDPLQTVTSVVRFPLQWQGRQNGMFILKDLRTFRLTPGIRRLLAEFAEQLAPNIDNMLLYEDVQRQRSLLDSVFDETSAGLAVIDQSGRVVRANEPLIKILNATAEPGKSLVLTDLLKSHLPESSVVSKVEMALREKHALGLDELTIGESALRLNFVPLTAFDLWTVIAVDITDLVELNKLKSHMLRIASHDLKNPLARIIGSANLIASRGQLSEQDQRYLGFIVKAANTMLGIISDILDIERLRAGKLRREDVNFTRLVTEICDDYRPDMLQRQQQFTLSLPTDDIYLMADPGQMSLAISNLIGNAVKYTPEGRTIEVRVTDLGASVRFEVQDSGLGIPADAQKNLFTEFFRVRNEHTAGITGTGLGLSLVKSVIEAHGGSVGVSSAEGVGSTFYFTVDGMTADVRA